MIIINDFSEVENATKVVLRGLSSVPGDERDAGAVLVGNKCRQQLRSRRSFVRRRITYLHLVAVISVFVRVCDTGVTSPLVVD